MKQYIILLVLLLLFGCWAPTPQQNTSPPANSSYTYNPPAFNSSAFNRTTACSDKQCFMAAANDCNTTDITVNEDYGVMHYQTYGHCIFTKTLVSLNGNESQEMRNLLEGKNMTCRYIGGHFDQRLVNSLIEGMENCTGELKIDLAKLIIFS